MYYCVYIARHFGAAHDVPGIRELFVCKETLGSLVNPHRARITIQLSSQCFYRHFQFDNTHARMYKHSTVTNSIFTGYLEYIIITTVQHQHFSREFF